MSFTNEQKDFLKRGQVRVIIPESPVDHESILDVPQRSRLFFDERLKVYVVLQLPECDEHELKSYLSRLEIGIDVWASNEGDNAVRPSANAGTHRDLISQQHIKRDDDPIVLLTQDDEAQVRINMVWEATIVVSRPRIRLMEPCVTILPTASISPPPALGSSDDFLQPYVAQEVNMFQPLKGAKGFENSTPYFPVSRLQTVMPPATKEDHAFHFAQVPPTTLRVFPVTMTRLKYTKAWGHPAGTALMVSLDVEMVPFVDVRGTINSIDVKLASGNVRALTGDMLPLPCQSKDCITFLYQLQARATGKELPNHISNPKIDVMTLSVRLTLRLTDSCQPEIYTEWTTNVDFSQPLERLSTPIGQSLQRVNRPPSLALQSHDTTHGLAEGLLSISFSAPTTPVKVGRPFAWKVLVVNRTSSTAKLAIIPLPKIQRTTTPAQLYARRHASRNSSTSFKRAENAHASESGGVAQASLDENILYALQHTGGAPIQADIVSLTSELKIGPLLAGQCYEDEIRMVAFTKGPHLVDAVRVVDMTRESDEAAAIVDIRDLPDIVAED